MNEPICEECGNDIAVDGFTLCTECLALQPPQGWYVVWCDECFTTLAWTEDAANSYTDDNWGEVVVWCVDQAHPQRHF